MKLLIVTLCLIVISCSTLNKSKRVPSSVQVTMESLRSEAFQRCQIEFKKPEVKPIPILDPPQSGGPEAIGMTYQEELAVRTSNFLDKDEFYMLAKPRLAVNNLPMDVFVERGGAYQQVFWEDTNPDFSAKEITPAIDKNQIPEFGKILTEVIVGHRAPDGSGYPQLFNFRSSGYVRFAGYPPMVQGASLRLGSHGLWSLSEPYSKKTEFNSESEFKNTEDFPIIRAIYLQVKNNNIANAKMIVENKLFCTAFDFEMKEGNQPQIVVDSYWYARRDFKWKKEPNTTFVAYSSMLWKTEKDTPENETDEAHDSDTVRMVYQDGSEVAYPVSIPNVKLRFHDFSLNKKGSAIKSWALANEDRNPQHYSYFAPALNGSNFDWRASYKVEILESSIKTGLRVYEHWTDGEYLDNIVSASTIRENISKSKEPKDCVHFKYRTTAYLEHRK